jgi:DNA repair exonuclease SbcCD ATPase subunit
MISNVYNSESLKSDIQTYKDNIQLMTDENVKLQKDLIDIQDRIIKGQEYRDGLMQSKHTDIDREISQLSPEKVNGEILSLTNQKSGVEKQLTELKVVEPSEFYHEDKHDEVKDEYNKQYKELVGVQTEIKSIEKLQSSVSGGIICEHCGIDLMNASITQAKINELAGFITHKDQIEGLMQVLSDKEKGFVTLKKEFDEYEKNKLIKEKYELSIESFDLKIKGLKDKLQKYNDLQDKILANDKIETQLLKAGQRITELESEKSNVSRKIDSNIFQIETSEGKILDNLSKIEKITEESEKEKIYKLYLEIYGKNGISKLIMKTMMPLINSELQRLLEDSSHFRLEVRINDKNEVEFIMVDNNTQVEKNISSGSGYERTIASLALRAVLSKICSLPKPNIIVFDEVFGKISNDNLDMVAEFFTKIKEYFEKIFVITHNPLVTNWADNVVKIKKEDNVSFVSQ